MDRGQMWGLTPAAAFVRCRVLDQAAADPDRVDEQPRRMHVHLDGDKVTDLAQADTVKVAIYLCALEDIDRAPDDLPTG